MKKIVMIVLGLLGLLHADTPTKMVYLYQKGAFLEACTMGMHHLKELESNEAHLSLYAFSCLKADQIDQLGTPLLLLNQSTEARTNASYFSMLILQKKLLMQALYDNYSLKSLRLPTSSHLLSKVFTLYTHDSQPQNSIKEYSEPSNPRTTYKLYTTQYNGRKTVAIDEYYDKILSLHHVY
ncbi:MAG: hypothetical protein ACXWB0_04290 [Sulfuricurvum sp.]